MNSKTLVMIGMFAGSIIGGYVPTLFGAGFFSFSSLIFSTIGAIVGIIIAYKLTSDY